MPHGLPAAFIEAVFTHVAVAKKSGCRAEKPVIVKGLDDGHLQVSASVIGRRRDERKRVVEMHDVGPAVLEQPT